MNKEIICYRECHFPKYISKLNNVQNIISNSPKIIILSIREGIQKIHNFSFIRLFKLSLGISQLGIPQQLVSENLSFDNHHTQRTQLFSFLKFCLKACLTKIGL